jgi:opacity protein-like surface antigen
MNIFLLATSLLIGNQDDVAQKQTKTYEQSFTQNTSCKETGKAFISIGGGYAWSQKASISASPKDWDPSPQGYNDNVKQSEVYTAGIGYHFRPIVSILFEMGYRPNFKYRKFQTSTATSTPGFLGEKTRHFRLSSLAFTFNAFLNKEGNCFRWKWSDCLSAAPFFGAGLGVSYNDVYDFHSVLPLSSGGVFHPVESIENNKVHAAFAGQVIAGLVFKVSQRFSFDLGYRWFYGGRFLSNNYIVDTIPGFATPQSSTAWKGVLRTNEVFINLNYVL